MTPNESELRVRREGLRGWAERLNLSGAECPLSAKDTLALVDVACSVRKSVFPPLAVRAALQTATRVRGVRASLEREGSRLVLQDENRGRDVYELKAGAVTLDDFDRIIEEIPEATGCFTWVVSGRIDPETESRCDDLYSQSGTEFAILDCLGFLRHFLHLFHRHRTAFLDAYQGLVLAEPDSAVSFELKQAFLAFRQTFAAGQG